MNNELKSIIQTFIIFALFYWWLYTNPLYISMNASSIVLGMLVVVFIYKPNGKNFELNFIAFINVFIASIILVMILSLISSFFV